MVVLIFLDCLNLSKIHYTFWLIKTQQTDICTKCTHAPEITGGKNESCDFMTHWLTLTHCDIHVHTLNDMTNIQYDNHCGVKITRILGECFFHKYTKRLQNTILYSINVYNPNFAAWLLTQWVINNLTHVYLFSRSIQKKCFHIT